MRTKQLVKKIIGIDNKLNTIIESNKKQSSWIFLILLPIAMLLIGIATNYFVANRITAESENQLREFIHNQTKKEIENINKVIENANTKIKNQIKNSTNESIEKIQNSVYPNDFKVEVEIDDGVGCRSGYKNPTCNFRRLQKRKIGESIQVDLTATILKVRRKNFIFNVRIFNNTDFVSLNTLISFYVETDAPDLSFFVDHYKKQGYTTFTDITPFETARDANEPIKLKGFAIVATPIEGGNYINFPFNFTLKGEKAYMGVKVRNNFFMFRLERENIKE